MSTNPIYHDAEIGTIAYSRTRKSVQLDFQQTSGDDIHLTFSGVRAFRVNDFGLQNVVSRVLVSTSRVFSADEVRDYLQWAHSQHDYKASLADAKATEIERALSQGALFLFVVEPSVGAEIVILCEGMEITV
ncbi:hypothetical protein [Paraburkholderia susongensis]|uniref:Uncharacterized protein n=1 Tax=Paraburkholderia susongensis TaxID=1515439 RepID=A0A1X7M5M6_9BURK|nr:hypothetical protein [Paraburkholderia susongensis]SMG60823.1 hypothetical protein SAMN06265784_1189 [Paraburkholderia susongensis]